MAAEALAVATAAAPHHTDNGSQGSTSNGFLVAAGSPSSSLRPHHAPAPADRAARWTAKGDPSVTLPPAPPPPIPPPHNNNSNHSSALNANSSFSSLLAKAGLVGGGAESAPPHQCGRRNPGCRTPPSPCWWTLSSLWRPTTSCRRGPRIFAVERRHCVCGRPVGVPGPSGCGAGAVHQGRHPGLV
jgi:hypothetical protein